MSPCTVPQSTHARDLTEQAQHRARSRSHAARGVEPPKLATRSLCAQTPSASPSPEATSRGSHGSHAQQGCAAAPFHRLQTALSAVVAPSADRLRGCSQRPSVALSQPPSPPVPAPCAASCLASPTGALALWLSPPAAPPPAGKGISKSALPYRRTPPSWLISPGGGARVQAREGSDAVAIGVILRDSHGIVGLARHRLQDPAYLEEAR